jgi:hypothetical protein
MHITVFVKLDVHVTNTTPFVNFHLSDAAKRKALPAWIREGLEKMEREKLRKEEKTRQDAEREEMRKRKLAEQLEQDVANEGKPVTESKWTAEAASRDPSSDEEEDSQREDSKITSHQPPESFQDFIKRAPEHFREELTASLPDLRMLYMIFRIIYKEEYQLIHYMFLINQRYAVRVITTKALLSGTNEIIRHAATEALHLVRTRTKSKKGRKPAINYNYCFVIFVNVKLHSRLFNG